MPKIIIVNAVSYAQGHASFNLAVELPESTDFDLHQGLDGELDGCKYTVFWEGVYHAGSEVLNIVVKWGDPKPS